jgi:hypothetical protein
MDCETVRKTNDVKEKVATLLIHHNLLHGKDWEAFHQDMQKLTEKYYPLYEKGMTEWWGKGRINNNI